MLCAALPILPLTRTCTSVSVTPCLFECEEGDRLLMRGFGMGVCGGVSFSCEPACESCSPACQPAIGVPGTLGVSTQRAVLATVGFCFTTDVSSFTCAAAPDPTAG